MGLVDLENVQGWYGDNSTPFIKPESWSEIPLAGFNVIAAGSYLLDNLIVQPVGMAAEATEKAMGVTWDELEVMATEATPPGSMGGWDNLDNLAVGVPLLAKKAAQMNKTRKVLDKLEDTKDIIRKSEKIGDFAETAKKGEKVVDVIKKGDVSPMKNFKKFPGDKLDGHEMLQNSWIKNNAADVKDAKSLNPALAVDPDTHKAINKAQRKAGLHNPANVKKQTATQNMRKNMDAMKEAGVPRNQIANQAKETKKHIKEVIEKKRD